MKNNNSSNVNRGLPNPWINRTSQENQSLEKRNPSIFENDRFPANDINNCVSPSNFPSQTRNNTYQYSKNDTSSNNRLIGLQRYRNQIEKPGRSYKQFSFQQQQNQDNTPPPINGQFSFQQEGRSNRRLLNRQFGAVHSPAFNDNNDKISRNSKNTPCNDEGNESNRGITNQNNDRNQKKYGFQSDCASNLNNTPFTRQNEQPPASSQSAFTPRSNYSRAGSSAPMPAVWTRKNENLRTSPTTFAPRANAQASSSCSLIDPNFASSASQPTHRANEKSEQSNAEQDISSNTVTPSRYWNDVTGSKRKMAYWYNPEKLSSECSDVIKKRKFGENMIKSEPRSGTANTYLNMFKKSQAGEEAVAHENTWVKTNSRFSLNDVSRSKRKISFRDSQEEMNSEQITIIKRPKSEINMNKNDLRSGTANAYLNVFQKPCLSEGNVGNRMQCDSRGKRRNDNIDNQSSHSSAHKKKTFLENEISSGKWILVLDTNVLLENLMEITRIVKSAYVDRGKPTIGICATVLRELDKLKMSDDKSLAERSQSAIRYINEEIRKEVSVVGETREEEEKYWNSRDNNDDRILNYCLRLRSDPKYIITLLTDDKNLANKAAINRLETATVSQFHQKFVLSIHMEMEAYYQSEKNRPDDLALVERIRSEESRSDKSSKLVEMVASSLGPLIIDFFNGVFQAYGRVKKWKEKYIHSIEEVVWMVQFTNTELCRVIPFSDTLFDVLRKFFDMLRRKKFSSAYVVKEILDRIRILVTSLKEELCEGRTAFLRKISELKSQLESERFRVVVDGMKVKGDRYE